MHQDRVKVSLEKIMRPADMGVPHPLIMPTELALTYEETLKHWSGEKFVAIKGVRSQSPVRRGHTFKRRRK